MERRGFAPYAPSTAVEEIASLRRDGDFYELTPKKNPWDQAIGPIQVFA
jgi:hypothetical protein